MQARRQGFRALWARLRVLLAPLTGRLWNALRAPTEGNPLYDRIEAQPIDLPGKRLLRPFRPLYGVIRLLLSVLAVVVAPFALWLTSNILGALIAFNVMSTIQRERDQRTYDLLALTPMGLGRANWLIAEACTQRVNAIERLATLRTLAIITVILLIFYLVGGGGLRTVIVVLAVILALNFDALQSIIIGCLSGMLAQEFSEQGAPFAAIAIFAFVQIILIYLPVTIVAVVTYYGLHPTRRTFMTIDSVVAVVVALLIFTLREMIIRLMWRTLEKRLL